MALTTEELLLQVNLLASKTSDNPDMTYKTNATLNKGLNPAYFTGQQTKIVNAINKLAEDSKKAITASVDTMDKLNSILLDVSNMDNAALFDQVKELMKAPTIIEGLHSILTGNNQEQVLDLKPEDNGKILMVQQQEDGSLKTITETIDNIILNHKVDSEKVSYNNEGMPNIENVKGAIDFLLNKANEPLVWEDITDAPSVPNEIVLEEGNMKLVSGDEEMSSIPVTVDEDIEDILDELN